MVVGVAVGTFFYLANVEFVDIFGYNKIKYHVNDKMLLGDTM